MKISQVNWMRCACISLFCLVVMAQSVCSQPTSKVAFKWGFAAKTGPQDERTLIAIRRDTVLYSGDSIKMVIEATKPCYVYVLYLSPTGEWHVLFPESSQMTNQLSRGKNYFIPSGQDWFVFDKNTGKETFYLLASAEPLTNLVNKLTEYDKAKGSSKKDLALTIATEIRNLKKQYRTFTSVAEKPISIGGNIRTMTQESTQKEVTDTMVEITAEVFYSKTYTITHE